MSTLSHSPGLEVQTTFYPSHCKAGKVKEGDHLTVHYIGQFDEDGNKFASSWDTNTPYRFQIGRGQVIKGWEEGLLGMCVGEIRKLKIPPELTLGGNAFVNVIPTNTIVYFVIQLMGIGNGNEVIIGDSPEEYVDGGQGDYDYLDDDHFNEHADFDDFESYESFFHFGDEL